MKNLAIFLAALMLATMSSSQEYNQYGEIMSQTFGETIIQKCVVYSEDAARAQTPCMDCTASLTIADDRATYITGDPMESLGGGLFQWKTPNPQFFETGRTYAAVFICEDSAGREGNVTGLATYIGMGKLGLASTMTQSSEEGSWVEGVSNIWDLVDSYVWSFWLDKPVDDIIDSVGAGDQGKVDSVGSLTSGIWDGVMGFKDGIFNILGLIPQVMSWIFSFISDPVGGTYAAGIWIVSSVWAFLMDNLMYFMMYEFIVFGIAFYKFSGNLDLLGVLGVVWRLHQSTVSGILSLFRLVIEAIGALLQALTSALSSVVGLIPGL
jgi:hypothetical protein